MMVCPRALEPHHALRPVLWARRGSRPWLGSGGHPEAALPSEGVAGCCPEPGGTTVFGGSVPMGDSRELGRQGRPLPGWHRVRSRTVVLVAPRIKLL